MRLFSLGLLTALFVPLAAYAQAAKQVEVTNLPVVQEVTGAVAVTNDAANPVEIAGEVSVTNLPTPTAAGRFQLVGFTTATFTGDAGVLGFTSACQSEFGSDSRMCSSAEVIETTRVPSAVADFSWVRPVFQPVSGNSPNKLALDASGLWENDLDRLTCRSWSPTGINGLLVNSQGQFDISSCDRARPIACCAPIP